MGQHGGRRTVSGLLFTRGGSILVFREENSQDKTAKCCSRIRCSGKYSESNCAYPKNNSLRHDCTQRDMESSLSRLKRRVNTTRKSMLSGERPSSSRRAHSARRQSSRSRNNPVGCNSVSVRACSSSSKRSRRASQNIEESLLPEPRIDRLLPHDGNIASQRRPLSFFEDSRTLASIASIEDEGIGYWHFNMEGSIELLLELETSSFWADHGVPDQLREMRMDIDDMSYEELLALGERIGVVSTGVREEALTECLKMRLYEPPSSISGTIDPEDCDIKCVICQEEYLAGDKVGEMACTHCYHLSCIKRWLRLKNWCPICRASASPAS